MKVALLKKVRKRFEIFHLPNGFTDKFGDRYNYNLFKLVDHNESHWYDRYTQLGVVEGGRQFCDDKKIFQTEKECIDSLKSIIIKRLRSEGHRGRKDKPKFRKQIKVWYI